MPLSEHEQRLLDEMERNLYQNDADFVAAVSRPAGRPVYRTVVIGVVVALLGLALLIGGVYFKIALLGILGFVVMLGGALLAITPRRRREATAPGGSHRPRPSSSRPASTQAGFMDRLNDRWDKRDNGSDG